MPDQPPPPSFESAHDLAAYWKTNPDGVAAAPQTTWDVAELLAAAPSPSASTVIPDDGGASFPSDHAAKPFGVVETRSGGFVVTTHATGRIIGNPRWTRQTAEAHAAVLNEPTADRPPVAPATKRPTR
ncbi:hypothetical protein [Iamia sp.]|uniref:hypothetical protein n=1 Tax=Iamia sp. TaxID=2722710 RepID=UPI002B64F174|nr:hypothetical protein [Iamia sp.]HXH56584.1 hypothetical protein [Iamia sp.]